MQRCGVVVIGPVQPHSRKTELRFNAGSNPVCGGSEICDGENLTMVTVGNKVKTPFISQSFLKNNSSS